FTAVLFAAVSIVSAGASPKLPDDRQSAEKKRGRAFVATDALNSRGYRSPNGLHKVLIPVEDREAVERAKQAGKEEISNSRSFKLFLLKDGGQSADTSMAEAELPISAQIRDDFNTLLLRSGAIDTTVEANFLRLEDSKGDATKAVSGLKSNDIRPRLRL